MQQDTAAEEPGAVGTGEGAASAEQAAAQEGEADAKATGGATGGAVRDQLGSPPDSLAPLRELMQNTASAAAAGRGPARPSESSSEQQRGARRPVVQPPAAGTQRTAVSQRELLARLMQPTRPALDEAAPKSPGNSCSVVSQRELLSRLMQPTRPAYDESPAKPPRKSCSAESHARLTSPKDYTGMYAKRFDAKGRGMGLKSRDKDAQLDLSQVTRPQLNPSANTTPDATTKPTKPPPTHKRRRRSKRKSENVTRRAKVLVKTTVRAGVERDSTKVGTLERGDEVLVLEQKATSDGQPRVRTSTGWVSIVAISGQPILQLMRPVHQKLSDTKLYTGTSRFHFDSSGKGKGLAGRPRDNWSARDYDEQGAAADLESTLRHSWRGSTPAMNATRSMHGIKSNQSLGACYHAPAGTILRTPPPHATAQSRDDDMRTEELSNKAELTNYAQECRPPSAVRQTPRTNDTKAAAAPTPANHQVQQVKSHVNQSDTHGQDLVEMPQSKSGQYYVDPDPDPEPASTPHPALESVPLGRGEDEDQQTT
eukprot:COSAG02_NODE_10897_length_1836_cov_1.596431_1_plen_538_part_01